MVVFFFQFEQPFKQSKRGKFFNPLATDTKTQIRLISKRSGKASL